jgi:hypothetical protein
VGWFDPGIDRVSALGVIEVALRFARNPSRNQANLIPGEVAAVAPYAKAALSVLFLPIA